MKRRPFLLLSFLAAYLLSYFYRSTNAVLADDLQRDAGIGTEELGVMTSLFFAAFAAAQLPLGAALDRWGPRFVPALLMLSAVAGSLITAAADGFIALAIGRALIGIGMAGVLMGALKAFSTWFEPQRFPLVSSLFVGLGSLGALGATTPLAALNEAIGWRGVFVAAGAISAAVALLLMVVVRARPAGSPALPEPTPERLPATEALTESTPGYLDIFRSADFWRVSALVFALTGGLFAHQGLWGGPFMNHGLGLGIHTAAELLFLLGMAATAGYLSAGPSAQRFGVARVISSGALAAAGMLAALALFPIGGPTWLLAALWMGYGFATGFGVLSYAYTRALFPAAPGRAVTAVNVFGISGSAVLQAGLGWVIASVALSLGGDPAAAPLGAYRAALWVSAGLLMVTWVLFVNGQRGRRPLLAAESAG